MKRLLLAILSAMASVGLWASPILSAPPPEDAPVLKIELPPGYTVISNGAYSIVVIVTPVGSTGDDDATHVERLRKALEGVEVPVLVVVCAWPTPTQRAVVGSLAVCEWGVVLNTEAFDPAK